MILISTLLHFIAFMTLWCSSHSAAAPAVPHPEVDNSPSARLVPLRPSWKSPAAAQVPDRSADAAQHHQSHTNPWRQPRSAGRGRTDGFMPRTPSAEEGDFWADQSAFAADMARLQLRQVPQPFSARSGAASSGRRAFEPDMDDVWAEQAAFEAELAALHDGNHTQLQYVEQEHAGRGDEDEDEEDMWRDLAAFEAEMEQLHGEAPQNRSSMGRASSSHVGLNPNAVSFEAAGFKAAVDPALADVGGGPDANLPAGLRQHIGREPETADAPNGLSTEPGEAEGGPAPALCPQHRAAGDCARGASCPFVHGDVCEVLDARPWSSHFTAKQQCNRHVRCMQQTVAMVPSLAGGVAHMKPCLVSLL